jgi:hypothetical protein
VGVVGVLLLMASGPAAVGEPFGEAPLPSPREVSTAPEEEGAGPLATLSRTSGLFRQARPGRFYSVKRGDTLCEIARRLLGDPRRYREIVRLNAARYPSLVKNPNLIFVGWELQIPSVELTELGITATTASGGRRPVSGGDPRTVAPPPVVPDPPSPAPAAGPASSAPSASERGEPLIGPGQRVLHIGDSHTVGVYGSTIDAAMRATGAQIRTYGVAGSSPRWWYNGTVTKCGYFSRDEQGRIDRPADWRTPRVTPSLPDLIKEFKPTVLVVSLGANLFGASEAVVRRETQRIIDTAKAAGCTLVWVGPPRARASVKPIAVQDRLCETIKATVEANQGTFIDSRPFTAYPATGGDGLHYGGPEGTRVARAWASGVLEAIQKSRR